MSATTPAQSSLGSYAARQLATAHVTPVQNLAKTPRWLTAFLPWVHVEGSVYRVNRRKLLNRPNAHVEIVHSHGVPFILPHSLHGLAPFGALPPHAVEEASAAFSAREYKAGDVVAEAGEKDKLFVVARGAVALSGSSPYGKPVRRALLGEGGTFGDGPHQPHGTPLPEARALSDSLVLSADWATLRGIEGVEDALAAAENSAAARLDQTNEFGEERIRILTSFDGEPRIPATFADYEENPKEYYLSTIQAILRTHTRVTDLYSNEVDQLREQVRLVVDVIKEQEEWELVNNDDFGLLNAVVPSQRVPTRGGPPTPDDLDELLKLVWKRPAFFLAHPHAITAFGREATRRGVPPVVVNLFGSPFITWRGVPLVPSDKLRIDANGTTQILLLRVGAEEQGVVGLTKSGVHGEIEPGLSVRYAGTDDLSVASHLLTRYLSAAVPVEDAVARLDNVVVGNYYDY